MRGELMLVGALHGGVGRDGRRPRSPAAGAKGGEVYGSWKDAPDSLQIDVWREMWGLQRCGPGDEVECPRAAATQGRHINRC